MIKLPQNRILKQLNLGDRFGDLWSSFNLDLTKRLGSLLISPRLLLNWGTDDDADMDEPPCAFKTFIGSSALSADIWAIAGNFMWRTTNGGPNDQFIQDATATTPTNLDSDVSDMEVFNGDLYVTSASTTIHNLSPTGTWQAIASTQATGAGCHAMTVFRALNRLYYIDDSAQGITSLNTSDVPVLSTSGNQYSLNDLVEGIASDTGSALTCIKSNSNRIWIGTRNKSGSFCRIYAWDGSQASGPNESYVVLAAGILAIVIKDDVPYAFDTRGRLLRFNGGTFVEVARLPYEREIPKLPLDATSSPVHYNGMSIIEGRINILINTELWNTNATIREMMPSGVWEYDPDIGLYHKASVGHTKSGGTIVDYGQQKLSLVGAIAEAEVIVVTGSIAKGAVNGRYLVGCDYYTTATVTKSGIFYDDANDTLQKAGTLITAKLFGPNIKEQWQNFYARFRQFLNSTDKIVVKYRVDDNVSSEATITYVNTTSFTVTLASTDATLVVGDEVEFIQGVGSGRTAHITAITGAHASSQTITVDETITGATTQTAKARFQSWKKIASYSGQADDFFPFPLSNVASPWIQFKVWILWTGKNEIYDFIVANQVNQKIE